MSAAYRLFDRGKPCHRERPLGMDAPAEFLGIDLYFRHKPIPWILTFGLPGQRLAKPRAPLAPPLFDAATLALFQRQSSWCCGDDDGLTVCGSGSGTLEAVRLRQYWRRSKTARRGGSSRVSATSTHQPDPSQVRSSIDRMAVGRHFTSHSTISMAAAQVGHHSCRVQLGSWLAPPG